MGNLAFKSCLYGPFRSAIEGRTIGVLAFRTILKICYRSSSKYLVAKNIMKSAIKGFEVRLEAELGTEGSSNLSISLSIERWPRI